MEFVRHGAQRLLYDDDAVSHVADLERESFTDPQAGTGEQSEEDRVASFGLRDDLRHLAGSERRPVLIVDHRQIDEVVIPDDREASLALVVLRGRDDHLHHLNDVVKHLRRILLRSRRDDRVAHHAVIDRRQWSVADLFIDPLESRLPRRGCRSLDRLSLSRLDILDPPVGLIAERRSEVHRDGAEKRRLIISAESIDRSRRGALKFALVE